MSKKASTNGIDPTVLKRWLGEALGVYHKLDEQKMENMRVCKTIRADLPRIYDNAKNAGLPLKAFKLTIKEELLRQQIDDLQEDIEGLMPEDEDDAHAFEEMRKIAHDGDLFDHAVKAHESKGEGDNEDGDEAEGDDPRPRFLKRDQDAAAANAAALKKGIKGMPGAEATEA